MNYDDDYNGKNEEEYYADEDEIVRQLNYLDIDPYEQDLNETFHRLSVYSPPYSTAMDCNTQSPPRRINQHILPSRRAQNQPPPSSTRATNYRRQEPENAHLFYALDQRRMGPGVRMEEDYTPELIDFTPYRQGYLLIVNDIINARINGVRTQYGQEVHKKFIRDFKPLIFRQSNIGDDIKFRIEQLYQRLLDNLNSDYNYDYNITKDKDYLYFCQELKNHIL